MESILPLFEHSRVIAACGEEDFPTAVKSSAAIVLLMNVTLSWLVRPEFLKYRKAKPILIHADLVKGLAGDREAVAFLRDSVRPWGIVSTRSGVLRAARKSNIPAIQRVFLIDTASLRVSINSIADNTPAAVELMPGVAPGPIAEIKEHVGVPVIAAGLIRTRDEALAALDAGADAVSMSEQSLWNERFR